MVTYASERGKMQVGDGRPFLHDSMGEKLHMQPYEAVGDVHAALTVHALSQEYAGACR